MAINERTENETVMGTTRNNAPAGVAIVGVPGYLNVGGAPGYIVLNSTNGTEVLLWARNDGKLYGGTRANYATPEAAGNALWP